MTKTNELHETNLFYVPRKASKGKTYKYVSTGADLHRDTRLLQPIGPKHPMRFHFSWKQNIRRVACLNTPKFSSVIIGLSDVINSLKKHNANFKKKNKKERKTQAQANSLYGSL